MHNCTRRRKSDPAPTEGLKALVGLIGAFPRLRNLKLEGAIDLTDSITVAPLPSVLRLAIRDCLPTNKRYPKILAQASNLEEIDFKDHERPPLSPLSVPTLRTLRLTIDLRRSYFGPHFTPTTLRGLRHLFVHAHRGSGNDDRIANAISSSPLLETLHVKPDDECHINISDKSPDDPISPGLLSALSRSTSLRTLDLPCSEQLG